ncbi:MAG: hypothetical protein OEV06_07070, partial [Anaerolineae bacterium]|nr:hypothetical protein [Anaerolineae bacterium]
DPFNTILVLFIFLRLTVLLFFTPTGPLNVYTDLSFYFHTLQYSDQGYYPFVNMWYEYPPLSTYLVQATYDLATIFITIPDVFSVEYQLWTRLLGLVLLAFDIGVLYLLYKIVRKAWGQQHADWTAMVYALASLPLFYSAYGHNIIMAFFTLLTIERFIEERYTESAVALGLAVASKLTPLFMLAPVMRFLWEGRRKAVPAIIKYSAIALGTAALFYLPFVLMGSGEWVAASFQALAVKGSWATIWALIDGNWTVNYGRLPEMIQLEMASLPRTNPPVIPEMVKSAGFALAFGWFYIKPLKDRSPQRFVWYAVLSALVFHLWSKGWSPQWITLIVPLLLMAFPGKRGLYLLLALTAVTMLEWPIADAFASRGLLAFTLLARTALFGLMTFWLGKEIIKPSQLETQSV